MPFLAPSQRARRSTYAKGRMEHGEWLPWLKQNCGVPERTAQRYMRLADGSSRPDTRRKSDTMADLTLTGAERLLGADEKKGLALPMRLRASRRQRSRDPVDTLVQSVDRTLAKLAKDDSNAAQAAATRIIAQASCYLAQAKAKAA